MCNREHDTHLLEARELLEKEGEHGLCAGLRQILDEEDLVGGSQAIWPHGGASALHGNSDG